MPPPYPPAKKKSNKNDGCISWFLPVILYAKHVSLYEITSCTNLYDVIMNYSDKQARFRKE